MTLSLNIFGVEKISMFNNAFTPRIIRMYICPISTPTKRHDERLTRHAETKKSDTWPQTPYCTWLQLLVTLVSILIAAKFQIQISQHCSCFKKFDVKKPTVVLYCSVATGWECSELFALIPKQNFGQSITIPT